MSDVYERLRARLDELAVGLPETENKIEIKLLKRLFTETEAEFFVHLHPLLEAPDDVASRLERDPAEVSALMEQMAKKGLLFRKRDDNRVRYAAVPYVVGIFEFQVKTLDKELAKVTEDYFEAVFGRRLQSFKTPVLRTIPINRQIVADWPIAPFEDVLQIVDGQEKIAIAPCICRTTRKLAEHDCDKPSENCFSFGSHADYYVENGMGRYISKEEARQIIIKNEEAGLVMQPFNSQKVGGMCSCCGDCCGMLRSLKKQPNPAEAVQSNYYARVDAELCTGCETCVDRCQMEAVEVVDGISAVLLNRCIGCGLCVTTCPTEAIQLVKKGDDQLYDPPKSGVETYMRIMQERGII
ncbi:MAG: 4Fe-4S binding protein [Desulfobacterales bacterium]|jgi:Na+-translocating ferredoxin:NAD+ oxidoreductase RNF subunit RnfB